MTLSILRSGGEVNGLVAGGHGLKLIDNQLYKVIYTKKPQYITLNQYYNTPNVPFPNVGYGDKKITLSWPFSRHDRPPVTHAWATYDIRSGKLLEVSKNPAPQLWELRLWRPIALHVASAWGGKIKTLEKTIQDVKKETLFLRFGRIPESGTSKNYQTGSQEQGISAYFADVDIIYGGYKFADDEGIMAGTGMIYALDPKKKLYLVEATWTGQRGSDGEPLITDAKILFELRLDKEGGYKQV